MYCIAPSAKYIYKYIKLGLKIMEKQALHSAVCVWGGGMLPCTAQGRSLQRDGTRHVNDVGVSPGVPQVFPRCSPGVPQVFPLSI